MRLGELTLDSTPEEMSQAMIGECVRRGYGKVKTIACVATMWQESGADPTAVNGNSLGALQQDGSYPGRANANSQIKGFLDRLDVMSARYGASLDPWLNIFWLQQRPGENSAAEAYANGRTGYLDEIRSRFGKAEELYNRYNPEGAL